jgi:hypothetical protein
MEQELLVAIPEAVANLTKLEKCGIIRKNKKSYCYIFIQLNKKSLSSERDKILI